MAILVVFQSQDLTQELYTESVRRLTDGRKDRFESAADWPVEGLLVHVAGEGERGFRVVDVWESEEAFRRFGEILVPILNELGVDERPEVDAVHAFVSA